MTPFGLIDWLTGMRISFVHKCTIDCWLGKLLEICANTNNQAKPFSLNSLPRIAATIANVDNRSVTFGYYLVPVFHTYFSTPYLNSVSVTNPRLTPVRNFLLFCWRPECTPYNGPLSIFSAFPHVFCLSRAGGGGGAINVGLLFCSGLSLDMPSLRHRHGSLHSGSWGDPTLEDDGEDGDCVRGGGRTARTAQLIWLVCNAILYQHAHTFLPESPGQTPAPESESSFFAKTSGKTFLTSSAYAYGGSSTDRCLHPTFSFSWAVFARLDTTIQPGLAVARAFLRTSLPDIVGARPPALHFVSM